jgi:dihydrofolate reductase
VIGVGGRLPWRIPDDLRRFRGLTIGGAVIMGRATFESIGNPLVDRLNIVMTRRRDYDADGVVVVRDTRAALEAASGRSPLYVIGGAEVYRELLPLVERVDLTVVDLTPEGDTTLDPFDPGEWSCAGHVDGEGSPSHSFHTLVRRPSEDGLACLPAGLVAGQSAS